MVCSILRYRSQSTHPARSDDFVLTRDVTGADTDHLFVKYAVHKKEDVVSHVTNGELVYVLRVCHIGKDLVLFSRFAKEDRRSSVVDRVDMFQRIRIAEDTLILACKMRVRYSALVYCS